MTNTNREARSSRSPWPARRGGQVDTLFRLSLVTRHSSLHSQCTVRRLERLAKR